MHAVAQRPAEALKSNFHDISIGKLNAFAETQAVCPKKRDMNISGRALSLELKMMMLEFLHAVALFLFAATNLFIPEGSPASLDCDYAFYGFEFRIKHQLRSNGAVAQLRSRQVQVILLLEAMI